MRIAHHSGWLLLLKAAHNLHWHTTVCVVAGPGRRRPIGVLTLGGEAEINGMIVAPGVIVAILVIASERELVLVAELGHRVRQHGYLLSVVVPDKVLVPLTPDLRLEFLRGALFVDFCDLEELLSDQVLMKLTILQCLLLVFPRLAEDRCSRDRPACSIICQVPS